MSDSEDADVAEFKKMMLQMQQLYSQQQSQMTILVQSQQSQIADLVQTIKDSQLSSTAASQTTVQTVASAAIPSFAAFDPESELWKDYYARFNTFASANSVPTPKLAQVFLTNQSTTTYTLLNTLLKQKSPDTSINDVEMSVLKGYMEEQFDPKHFVVRERFRFWSEMKRKPGETVLELAARIRREANTCDFTSIKDPQDEALRTKFICSIQNEAVLKALFKVDGDKLTFAKAIEIASETEEAAKVAKETAHGSATGQVHKVLSKPQRKFSKGKTQKPATIQKPATKSNSPCWRCDKSNHTSEDCHYKEAICNYCHIKGHIEAACRKKKASQRCRIVHCIDESGDRLDPLVQTLNFGSKQWCFEIDTGARDNFCDQKLWTQLGKPVLSSPVTSYMSATGDPIPVLGTFVSKVSMDSPQRSGEVQFNVTSIANLNLLGRRSIKSMSIDIHSLLEDRALQSILRIDNSSIKKLQADCNKLCKEFPELFTPGLGCLKDFELEVAFKSDATPVFHKPRTVPFALLQDLSDAYDAGIEKGVWTPTQFNDYGTPVVPVKKALLPGQTKAKLRVCGDYSVSVNHQLEVHRHPLPLPEELMRKLGGGFCFTKIDLADAYNQIKLAPESQRRLALSTHRGVLLQTRLPFGISSAPGYFQEIMDKLTCDLPGVATYLDDILVSGKDAMDHLQNLRGLLQRLKDKGLRCNLKKCEFAQPSVQYLGHTLSLQGISKGSKVEAVLNMPPPTDISTLRSFLGSIQFYGKFIQNLASLTEPLNQLLKKETAWRWGHCEQQAFETLKKVLNSDQVLAHFEPDQKIGISCDASSVGVGVVLFHRYADGSERPIANVSKTLTETQRRYSQVQREALAIIFGLRKFHQFLYGREFILITDHRPLVSLFGPTKGTPALAANRLARWALILSQYEYTIEYRNTEQHGNADALSRMPLGPDSEFDVEEENEDSATVCHINFVDCQLNPCTPGVLAKESRKDPAVSSIMRFVREGWPQSFQSDELKHYKKNSEFLSVENGCLLMGTRIVIPTTLRRRVLDLIHLGHFGIQRMKQLARSAVYWPRIDSDIEELCKSCTSCQHHAIRPPKSANHPWMVPEQAWSRLHIDHAVNFLGSNWLIIIDAKTKYPVIYPTTSLSSKSTMNLLEETFAHFGYPHAIVSDNATSFSSDEFQTYLNERGIVHLHGAPYHPATNGMAERMVATFKQSLRKSSLLPKQALNEFLMQYRRTPLENGLSPCELLMRRQIRTKLDCILPSPENQLARKQVQGNTSDNQRSTSASVKYPVGTPCYALYYGPRREKSNKWVPAIVVKTFGARSVNVKVCPSGPVWRRHMDQLRPRLSVGEDSDPPPEDTDPPPETPTLDDPAEDSAESQVPAAAENARPTESDTPVATEVAVESYAPDASAGGNGKDVPPKRRDPRWPTTDEFGIDNPRRSARLASKQKK